MKGRRRLPITHMIGLGVLPFVLVFSSWVPLLWFAFTLGDALGIPWDAPVRDQPFGWLWLFLFIVSMWAFMLTGLWLGLYSVVAILRRFYGWTWAEVSESIFAPQRFGPAMWGLNDATPDPVKTDWSDHPLHDPLLDENFGDPLL